ncbi:uncharacterized protein LOC125682371 [Ostrea edulis]|uniref:uncharacterized protein LOC125682371 n=1 Tax=Ostrea edulis TaxID=37623 RepID=UPI0024AF6698|nr:uncharacterized protein LOC125682371 [Ostrea edulis]
MAETRKDAELNLEEEMSVEHNSRSESLSTDVAETGNNMCSRSESLSTDVAEMGNNMCSRSESLSTDVADTENNVQVEWSQYECQYLDFTPKSLINGEYNVVVTSLKEGFSTVEAFINEEFGSVISPEQTKRGLEAIQALVVEKLDTRFDKLESYLLRNVFSIPGDLVLPEDRVQVMHPITPEEDVQLEADMEQLRKQITAIRYANEYAKQQITEIDNLQKHADVTHSYLQRLENSASDAGVLGMKDSLSFVLNKMEELMTNANELQEQNTVDTDSPT